jgi:hypothetical protein
MPHTEMLATIIHNLQRHFLNQQSAPTSFKDLCVVPHETF